MTIKIVQPSLGLFDFTECDATDRLSLAVTDGKKTGHLFIWPSCETVTATNGDTEIRVKFWNLCLQHTPFIPLEHLLRGCKATACQPERTIFPVLPRLGAIGDIQIAIQHRRHADTESIHTLSSLTITGIFAASAAAVEHTSVSHRLF